MALSKVGLQAVIENMGEFQKNGKAIKVTYETIENKAKDVVDATSKIGPEMSNLGSKIRSTDGDFKKVKVTWQSFDKQVNTNNKSVSKLRGVFSTLGPVVKSAGLSIATAGALAATAAVSGFAVLGAAIVGVGTKSLQTSISFEDAFAGVSKTVDGVADSTGKLTDFGEELRGELVNISTQIPSTFEQLSGIGEVLGQLGVPKEAIADMTQTVANLDVTTNLMADNAASSIARIQNIYQVAADDMGENTQRFGSALVDLGNNFATTESSIMNFTSRIAGAGKLVDLSQADILGIGTAFSSVGIEAEAGGTATQKVLLRINQAVQGVTTGFIDNTKAIDQNTGQLMKLNAESARLEAQAPGLQQEILNQYDAFIAAGGSAEEFGRQLGDKTRQKAFETAVEIRNLTNETEELRAEQGKPVDASKLTKFAQVAGVSADKFKTMWEEDASQAFTLFVEGLGREGDNATKVLDDLELRDMRLQRAFLSLAGAGDLLNDAIVTSNDAFEENTALTEEAQKRYATAKSQITILKNNFRALADTIGYRLLPFFIEGVTKVSTFLSDGIKPLGDFLDNTLIPSIEDVIGYLGEWVDAFQEGESAVAYMIPNLTSKIQNAWPVIEQTLATWGNNFWNWLTVTAIPQTSSKLTMLSNVISSVLTTVWETIILPKLTEWGTKFFDWVIGLYPQIPTILTNLVNAIANFIGTAWETIGPKLDEWVPKFWQWISNAIDQLGVTMTGLSAALVAWVTSPEAQEALNNLGKTIGDYLVGALELNIIQSGLMTGLAVKFLLALGVGILVAVGTILETLIIAGGQIVAGILSGILEALGINLEPATFSELSGILTRIGQNIMIIAEVVGTSIIDGIIDGINSIVKTLYTTVSGIFENVKTLIKEVDWLSIGEGILNGVMEGIDEKAEEFYDKVYSIAAGAIESAKDALGIGSPSKRFIEIGKDVIQGLIIGMDTMSNEFAETLDSFITPMLDAGDFMTWNLDEIMGRGPGADPDYESWFHRGRPIGFWDARTAIVESLPALIQQIENGTASADSFRYAIHQALTKNGEWKGEAADSLIDYNEVLTMVTEGYKDLIEQITLVNSQETLQMAGSFIGIGQIAVQRLDSAIEALQELSEEGGYFRGNVISAEHAQQMLNEALQERATIEREILDLQQAQADLDFLTAQLDLLRMINDAGLDLADFGSIRLGLDADIGDLVRLANLAVQGMIGQLDVNLDTLSAKKGLGFQSGTFGFTVPGSRNTPFPITLHGQEEVVVAPAGRSIEQLLAPRMMQAGPSVTNNYFNLNVGSVADGRGVIQQFDVMRALVN